MRGLLLSISFLIGMFTAGCQTRSENSDDPLITYTFTPVFTDQGAQILHIHARFNGDEDGETEIRLGGPWANEREGWKRYRDLSVKGIDVTAPSAPDGFVYNVNHAPGTELIITYFLSSDHMRDPASDIEYFYAPVIQTDIIHLIGTSSLVVPLPDNSEKLRVKANWESLPDDWKTADTLPGKPLFPGEIRGQLFVAGKADFFSSAGTKDQITIVKSGQHDFTAKEFNAHMLRVMDSLNDLWMAEEEKYMLTLLGTSENSSHSSFTGTGRYDSFASAASRGIDLPFLTKFLSHEVAHNWVPGKLGWPSKCKKGEDCPPKTAWFTEGFTDFVMTQAMVDSGQWSQKDWIDFTNLYLRNYHKSAAKNAKALAIDEQFWSDFEHERQPYWRGYLIALMWNRDVMQNTSGKTTAMDILRAMRDKADIATEEDFPVLTSQYIAKQFSEAAGRDVHSDIERFYLNGETLPIQADLFQDCGSLTQSPVYQYDVGFDPEATLGSGIVSGVKPGSNANKAGLKNGQILESKVSGGGGDTTIPLVLKLNDGKSSFEVSYYPVSGDPVLVPQFEINERCSE